MFSAFLGTDGIPDRIPDRISGPVGAFPAAILAAFLAVVPPGPAAAQASSLSPPGADEPGLVVTLNLPAFAVEVYRDGERIRRYPAAIGLVDFATPTGAFTIARIDWNPWWNPPPSEWARNEVRTPPGPRNPMGRAKIHFEGLLFIHGTANAADTGQAVSHGCVRIRNEDVLDLARLLALENGALTAAEIDRLERNPSATREVALDSGIPLRIRYRVVETVDGEVESYPDVYRYGITEEERDRRRRARDEDGSDDAAEARDEEKGAARGPVLAGSDREPAPGPAFEERTSEPGEGPWRPRR